MQGPGAMASDCRKAFLAPIGQRATPPVRRMLTRVPVRERDYPVVSTELETCLS